MWETKWLPRLKQGLFSIEHNRKLMKKFFGGDGAGKIVTLDNVAAHFTEEFNVFLDLHSFRNGEHVQFLGHFHDAFQNQPPAVLIVTIAKNNLSIFRTSTGRFFNNPKEE